MIAHLDPVGGISGDMFLGALVDAGVPLPALQEALSDLLADGVRISARAVERSHVPATQVLVELDEHAHERAPHERTLEEILAVLDRVARHPADRERAEAVFRRLAAAEAQVHHSDETHVHFHEVGALDAIADVLGTVAGMRLLAIDSLTCGPLPLGHGVIQAAHGVLPNPAPATQALLVGLVVQPVDIATETVTPTGAALVATLATAGPAPAMHITAIGVGAGGRDGVTRPNVARLYVGTPSTAPGDVIVVIRSTLDNASAEVHGYVLESLMALGVRDAYFVPAQMKKSRPGVQLTVLCDEVNWRAAADVVLRETGSLGVRVAREERLTLPRRHETVVTPWGEGRVKIATLSDGRERVAPEYEDARALALAAGVPLREVMAAMLQARPAS